MPDTDLPDSPPDTDTNPPKPSSPTSASSPPPEPPPESVPEAKTLTPEAVEAAQRAVKEATTKAEENIDGKNRDQILSALEKVTERLDALSKKIEETGSVKVEDLTRDDRVAVAIADRETATGFLAAIDAALDGVLTIPAGFGF